MGILNTSNPTLADVVSRLDGNKKIDTEIIEMMSETNEMLQDLTSIEANGVTEHLTTVRTGLPEVAWRMLNWGVQPSKSTTAQIKDSIGMLSALSEIDKKLAQINGWSGLWRLTEDSAFIEAMSQKVQRAVIYGNDKTGVDQILGLAPRYCSGDPKKADNAKNIIDAGGKGNKLTSIWLLCWSPRTLFTTYPKGSRAGISHQDLGEYLTTDAEGGKYVCLGTKYDWDLGLVLRDWRYVVRIANIDQESLTDDPQKDGGTDLIRLLMTAKNKLPNFNTGRIAFYCNREVRNALEAQCMNRKNVQLSLDQVSQEHPVLKYAGIPIRIVDALTPTEKRVPFPTKTIESGGASQGGASQEGATQGGQGGS